MTSLGSKFIHASWSWWALLAAAIAAVILSPLSFYGAYIFSFIFWLGISLGAIAILLLGECTGGRWFGVLRPHLQMILKTLPLLAVLFLPVLIKMGSLYSWVELSRHAGDSKKLHYLTPPLFTLRAVIYFCTWLSIAHRLNALGERGEKMTKAPGALVALILTLTFASIDWIMSLQTEFYSTVFGLLFLLTCALSALAFVIARRGASAARSASPGLAGDAPSRGLDLGNLLLAFTMTWTYLAFMQFLIVWMGNLPEESNWYVRRLDQGWQYFAYALLAFQFFLPFFILLFRPIKKSPVALGRVAALSFFMQVVYAYWVFLPLFHHERLLPTLADICFFGLIGLLWFNAYGRDSSLSVFSRKAWVNS